MQKVKVSTPTDTPTHLVQNADTIFQYMLQTYQHIDENTAVPFAIFSKHLKKVKAGRNVYCAYR
jgi:hypothetical protein